MSVVPLQVRWLRGRGKKSPRAIRTVTQASYMRPDAASEKTQVLLALILGFLTVVCQCVFRHLVRILAFSLIWNAQSAPSANHGFVWHEALLASILTNKRARSKPFGANRAASEHRSASFLTLFENLFASPQAQSISSSLAIERAAHRTLTIAPNLGDSSRDEAFRARARKSFPKASEERENGN